MTEDNGRYSPNSRTGEAASEGATQSFSATYSVDDVPSPDQTEVYEEYSEQSYDPAVGAYTTEQVFQEQIYADEPRRAELTLARIDPWSALKIGFLISIALGIATVVATVLLWFVLDGMNVFGSVEDFLIELNAERFLTLMDYVRLPRVMSYATMLGVANVVIFTALSALVALLYNLIAALVGGIRVSLMDE